MQNVCQNHDGSNFYEMSSGYSKTPLAKKLGLKPRASFVLYNPPKQYFSLFQNLPEDITELSDLTPQSADFIHVFCTSLAELDTLITTYKPVLKMKGILWVSWPKGSSKITTDIKREPLRDLVLNKGLVDVKVTAIDPDWSGLKFVYRLKDRT
ncbi:DUF3052 domain-containing protein [Psychroserpens sp. SPM9]|uniref:DUF3052 domain-containing protein n=1 Tax=Psychroserpens sp. SPM9 TaxID=2975598 RepID=UPI0021A927EE|nr:DUF3052 domain-containing protein [Psychroserpens sp. SPM9]MDG5491472.1 DUF3052 domain-containing protein [Psychroserpens sp. SPM9]